MRRLIPITALAFLLGLPALGQRGGHLGGGSHGGFSSGESAFGAHAGGHFSSPNPGMAHSFGHAQNGARGSFFHPHFRSDRRFRFRNYCYGYPCRVGYGYLWWGYDPWFWDGRDDSINYDDDYDRDLQTANDMNQRSLEEQRMLRQEEADGDQDVYAPHPSVTRNQQAPVGDHGEPIFSPTLLVFRDRHTEEIRNYAILGGTLWNFAGQRTQKISLSELDLPATVKANGDRGITFALPAIPQGQ